MVSTKAASRSPFTRKLVLVPRDAISLGVVLPIAWIVLIHTCRMSGMIWGVGIRFCYGLVGMRKLTEGERSGREEKRGRGRMIRLLRVVKSNPQTTLDFPGLVLIFLILNLIIFLEE